MRRRQTERATPSGIRISYDDANDEQRTAIRAAIGGRSWLTVDSRDKRWSITQRASGDLEAHEHCVALEQSLGRMLRL